MKFSVVTVCLNSEKTIARCIASVAAQKGVDLEYIIVDGQSSDGTCEIIRNCGTVVTRWISEKDGGIYDAMNKGVQMATGDYVHLLNSDDFYLSDDCLWRVSKKLDSSKLNYAAIRVDIPRVGYSKIRDFRYSRLLLNYSAYLPHPGLIVAADQYRKCGLYDTRYRIAADHDFILRALQLWRPNQIADVLTVMEPGFSSANAVEGFGEFERISVQHGTPPAIAALIRRIKVWRYKRRFA